MLLIQILIVIFAAFLIGRTLVNFQKHKLDLKQTIIWMIVWIILLIVGILPEVMGIPALILGIQRSVDVFIYVGIVILFYIVFLLYSKLESQREKITKLIRVVAIMQAETEALLMEKASKTIKKVSIPDKKTKTKRKTKKK
jgi:small membrane protein